MSVAPEPVNPEHESMTIDPSNLGSVDPLSVEGLFLVALGKQGDARAAFLAETCADTEQRQRVEALLTAYESAGSFLEKPAIDVEPIPMGQYLSPCEVPGAIGKLGPYEILEEIGRGGMGVVFRAHDPKLQRIVAVKALAPELARLPSARQRFLREARAAAAISHPHVVTIFAVDGTEEASLGAERTTLPYLVMECIVGQTLHDKIKRVGALKTEEIVRISRQIAEGLTAAHKRGLIHRDIKPANILLENGVERVKITDFGLARTITDGGITHTGEILGTPQCMSPEQARGEMVDQRSDLFSLGCVMYTMCTGVNPFRADNMLAVMKKVCEATPRPIAELNPEIPEWLGQLVHQLLEKQAENRVQTAEDVVETLEARATVYSPTKPHANRMSPGDTDRLRELPPWQRWLPIAVVVAGVIGSLQAPELISPWMMWSTWLILGWTALKWAQFGPQVNWQLRQNQALAAAGVLFAGGNLLRWMWGGDPRSFGDPLLLIAIVAESLTRSIALVLPVSVVSRWLVNILVRGFISSQPVEREESRPVSSRTTELSWLEQLARWQHWLSVVVLISGLVGLAVGQNRYTFMVWLPVWGALVWGVLSWAKLGFKLDWSWINWRSCIASVAALFCGANLRAWMMVGSPRPSIAYDAENFLRQNAGVFVLPLAIGIFWLLTKLMPWGFIQTRPLVATGTPVVPTQPRSPWNIFGWFLVSFVGFVMLVTLGLAVAWIVPYLAMSNAPMSTTIGNRVTAPAEVHVQIQSSLIETITGVTIDGTPAFVTQIHEGMWQLKTTPGEHKFVVSFQSPDPAVERVYESQIDIQRGLDSCIEAVPVNRPVVQGGTSGASVPKSIGGMMGASAAPAPNEPMSSEKTAEPADSIPLADAVEVLTDTENWPRYPYAAGPGAENGTHVWIDQPGLVVRLKPIDFEGREKLFEEYIASCDWGSGYLKTVGDPRANAASLAPGRYRVLVQDLDYGWELDRRGTIVIGQGMQTIHVKRSFVGQQMVPKEYPVNFRWAGKSYPLTTVGQVVGVNDLVADLSGESPQTIPGEPISFEDTYSFGNPLAEQIQENLPAKKSLKYTPRTMKLEIPAGLHVQSVTFISDRGHLTWDRSVPEGFSVPSGPLKTYVTYKPGFAWGGDNPGKLVDLDALPNQTLVVGGFTKAVMREAVIANQAESGKYGSYLGWFEDEPISLHKLKVRAAERLVLAWLDGQPDVPEAELLELGQVDSWDKLWENGEAASPEGMMPHILQPGTTPGTWRLKEPPEGAVARE